MNRNVSLMKLFACTNYFPQPSKSITQQQLVLVHTAQNNMAEVGHQLYPTSANIHLETARSHFQNTIFLITQQQLIRAHIARNNMAEVGLQ
jgi:hypothetical protein